MKQFFQLTKKNELKSNLTELNAADSVNTGFMNHNDWLAHVTRYGHVMDAVQRRHAFSILDVGCGRLQLLKYLWRNRSQFDGVYTGLDLRAHESWLEEIGWAKGNLNLVQMDVVLDDLPNSIRLQYDVVVCTEVLEHIPREYGPTLMKKLYDWTAPGGVCFLSTPNAGVSESTAENHKDADGISREWTYDDKVILAKQAGFQLTNAWGTFIAIKRTPSWFLETEYVRKIREFLPYSYFSVFSAAPFPRESNNCMMELSK